MIAFLFNQAVQGQERKGFEGYYYPANGASVSSLSTKVFYQTSQGWYAECRYNYEEEKTAGFSVGKLQGVSLGLNISLSWKRLSFCSSLLKTSGLEKDAAGYSLFNWSELNMRITSCLYGGATVQLSSSGRTVIRREPAPALISRQAPATIGKNK
jgi:hypothetical protein